MLTNDCQFALEFCTIEGKRLGQRRVEPNWEPACEWAKFSLLRKAVAAPGADTAIEPIAHRTAGAPYASGFRVKILGGGQELGTCDFPITYFHSQAREVSAEFVKQGLMQDSETFRYLLMAYPREAVKASKPAPGFTVTEVPKPPSLRQASLSQLAEQATLFGEQEDGDVPVFIPQQVIEETAALTEQAGKVETGGILIGHLCRDESIPDLGVVVTAQIPARHTEGDSHKLTFTAETWAAAQAAISLRRTDEMMLGWWHSHPAKFWCSPQCPPERRRECPFTRNFFSADDVCLHETVFAKAFQIALVATNTDDGIKHALFGWRAGMVCQRGFKILNNGRPSPLTAANPALSSPSPLKGERAGVRGEAVRLTSDLTVTASTNGENSHATKCQQ